MENSPQENFVKDKSFLEQLNNNSYYNYIKNQIEVTTNKNLNEEYIINLECLIKGKLY